VVFGLLLSLASCGGDDAGSPAGPSGSGASGGSGGAGASAGSSGSSGAAGTGQPPGPASGSGYGVESCELAESTLPDGPKYYVDPAGDDDHPGTETEPWRTLAKANATLEPGDTVIVRAGTYAEVIRPERSGTSASERIVYLASPGEVVRVTGGPDGDAVVDLTGRDFVTVDGFHVKQAAPRTDEMPFADVTIRGVGNVVKNCSIVSEAAAASSFDAGIREIGFGIYSGEDNVLEGNRVDGLWFGVIVFDPSLRTTIRCNSFRFNYMDGVRFESRKHVIAGDIVERNNLGESFVSDGVQFNGDFDLSPEELATDTSSCGVVIRRNKIFGNAENAVDLKGTCHILVEDNLVYGNVGDNDGTTKIAESCSDTVNDRCGGMAIMLGSGTSSRDIVIRRNVVYDNSGGIYAFGSWRVYHNTIVANNRDYTGPSSEYERLDKPQFVGLHGWGRVKNNLVGNHHHSETSLSSDSEVIDGNLYFNTLIDGAPFFAVGSDPWEALTFPEWQGLLASEAATGAETESLVGAPLFVSVPDRPTLEDADLDFSLGPGSAAIDRGVPLARTLGSGSGTSIGVDDAGWFFDGFGVTAGDRIVVGQNPAVRITSIDHDANVLEVDQAIGWNEGDGVSLEHSGAAPDIGAFERAN
jgi:hypothetical protein